MTGQIKAAWWYFTFVGAFDLNKDFTDEDLEVFYPDVEEK